MAIKAVCFDLDDTLLWDERSVREAFEATCRSAQDAVEIDPVKLEESVRKEARELYESYETFPFTKMIGINPFEGLWANFSAGEQPEFRQLEQLAPVYRKESWRRGLLALGVDHEALAGELAEQFGRERRSRPHVYEETFMILNELKGNVKLLLLTNGCPALQQEKLDGVPELATYFNEIVISGSYGRGKPDATIFRHALERLGVEPEESLMVGDKLTTDICGGLSAGMTTVWVNRDGKVRNDEIVPDYEVQHLSQLHDIIAKLV
ncbi:putative hydrolase of the HAD superfamily [Fontibacillus phaseoli]|uniref:Phosphoserine phosphatase n=1 Tax=Fontibacillus phaseoli TaxID=1416533 RepID=A0A369BPH0_9BACL|nr:HAD family hydrolase [Fontibacillus phaseoli]RCX23519.1 putative hydrolase of the HAD superfamily [Fontibacillus phaseoli]